MPAVPPRLLCCPMQIPIARHTRFEPSPRPARCPGSRPGPQQPFLSGTTDRACRLNRRRPSPCHADIVRIRIFDQGTPRWEVPGQFFAPNSLLAGEAWRLGGSAFARPCCRPPSVHPGPACRCPAVPAAACCPASLCPQLLPTPAAQEATPAHPRGRTSCWCSPPPRPLASACCESTRLAAPRGPPLTAPGSG